MIGLKNLVCLGVQPLTGLGEGVLPANAIFGKLGGPMLCQPLPLFCLPFFSDKIKFPLPMTAGIDGEKRVLQAPL